MKSAEASDHNQKCQDVIAVLSLQDKHPLPEGQAAALIVGVLEMSKTASFRAWFCQSVDAATTRGVVHTLATHTDRRQDALAALRNLCACGEAVQNCVIDELDTLTSKEGANVSVLVLQVIQAICCGLLFSFFLSRYWQMRWCKTRLRLSAWQFGWTRFLWTQ
jgi:hypothetical protein